MLKRIVLADGILEAAAARTIIELELGLCEEEACIQTEGDDGQSDDGCGDGTRGHVGLEGLTPKPLLARRGVHYIDRRCHVFPTGLARG